MKNDRALLEQKLNEALRDKNMLELSILLSKIRDMGCVITDESGEIIPFDGDDHE